MNDERLDRLYNLLPAIYRIRDQEQGEPFRALLRVIAEQVNVVDDDITRLYENWFIETCEDWVVPYIGDLVGYQPVHEVGEPGEVVTPRGRLRNKVLIPRRDVANTVANRHRKGTLALLEELAKDAAGWPGRAVEFYTLLSRTQHINHLRLTRGLTASLHDNDTLAKIDGPFDSTAHTIDVRRINSRRSTSRYNIPSVGLFVWRLKPYTVTKTPACCVEEIGPHCYTFSVLGHDTQLFANPQQETDPRHIAEELNLPVPIRRWSFDSHKENYYGEEKSIQIHVPGWSTYDPRAPLPLDAVIPANLSDWSYRPPLHHVAVDPVLGRIIFPPSQLPRKSVHVSYVYAFSADIGGGEYNRSVSQPTDCTIVRVGRDDEVKRIGEAWARIQSEWKQNPDKPENGMIEILDGSVYVEQLLFELGENQSLQIRAANRVRPILRLLDWQTDMSDALCVILSRGSRITLDGLLISGRSIAIRQKEYSNKDEQPVNKDSLAKDVNNESESIEVCPAEVIIRHSTLVPGWGLDPACKPRRPAEPSLELYNVRARVRIEHSIIGSIQVNEDQVHTDPIRIAINDSILDATRDDREALGAPGRPMAHAVLTILRSTVFGKVLVHAIELAENCIFTNCLSVARRQLGCMHFCYVPEGCRTPRRYHCQPDLAEQMIEERLRREKTNVLKSEIQAAHARERTRVRPQFNSKRYGRHDYAQLADLCAEEIKRGADDESEMGVFHDLFNPQREANLCARLDEYTPAGMQTGVIKVT